MAKKTKSKSKPKRPTPDSMSFEDAVEELEQIIERIEEGEIGLEESLAERQRGETLIKRTRAILDAAEQELEEVSAEDVDEAPGDEERDESRV